MSADTTTYGGHLVTKLSPEELLRIVADVSTGHTHDGVDSRAFSLTNLSDVPTPTGGSGKVLEWQGGSTYSWIATPSAGGSSHTLGGATHTDVDVSLSGGPNNNDIIQYNSTSGNWENKQLSATLDLADIGPADSQTGTFNFVSGATVQFKGRVAFMRSNVTDRTAHDAKEVWSAPGTSTDLRLTIDDASGVQVAWMWNASASDGEYLATGPPAGKIVWSENGTSGMTWRLFHAANGTDGNLVTWTETFEVSDTAIQYLGVNMRDISSSFYNTGNLLVARGGTGRTSLATTAILMGADTAAIDESTLDAFGQTDGEVPIVASSDWTMRRLTAADVDAGTFPSGDYVFQGDVTMTRSGSNTVLLLRSSNLASGSPSVRMQRQMSGGGAVTAAVRIGEVQFEGYDGTSYETGARVQGKPAQTWTVSAHGAGIEVHTVATNSTTLTHRWTFEHGGHFVPSANDTYDVGAAGTRISTLYAQDIDLGNALPPAHGGTGNAITVSAGDTLQGQVDGTLDRVAIGANGEVPIANGTTWAWGMQSVAAENISIGTGFVTNMKANGTFIIEATDSAPVLSTRLIQPESGSSRRIWEVLRSTDAGSTFPTRWRWLLESDNDVRIQHASGAEGSESFTDFVRWEHATPQWRFMDAVTFDEAPNGSGANLTNLNADNLASGTVPSTRVAGSYTSITGVGTITTGVWNGTLIAPQYGGTGLNTAAVALGDLLIGQGSGAWRRQSIGSNGQVLKVVTGDAQWADNIATAIDAANVNAGTFTGSFTFDSDLVVIDALHVDDGFGLQARLRSNLTVASEIDLFAAPTSGTYTLRVFGNSGSTLHVKLLDGNLTLDLGSITISNGGVTANGNIVVSSTGQRFGTSNALSGWVPFATGDHAYLRSLGDMHLHIDSDANTSGNYFRFAADGSTTNGTNLARIWGNGGSVFGNDTTQPAHEGVYVRRTNATTTFTSNDAIALKLVNVNTTPNNWSAIAFADGVNAAASAMVAVQFTDHVNDYSELSLVTRRAGTGLIQRLIVGDSVRTPGGVLLRAGGNLRVDGQAYNNGLYDLGTQGGNFSVDWDNGGKQKVTVSGDLQIDFTNIVAGAEYFLTIKQQTPGGHTVTFSSKADFGDGVATNAETADEETSYVFIATSTSMMQAYRVGVGFTTVS